MADPISDANIKAAEEQLEKQKQDPELEQVLVVTFLAPEPNKHILLEDRDTVITFMKSYELDVDRKFRITKMTLKEFKKLNQ